MNRLVFCVLPTLMLAASCIDKKSESGEQPSKLISIAGVAIDTRGQCEHIAIGQGTTDSIVQKEAFVASIDTLALHPDSGCYVSAIQDVCLSDSCLFVLDRANNIFAFSRGTGKQVAMLSRHGRGKGEYIKPVSIAMHNGTLYVLDLQAMRVKAYDSDMRFVEDISISFAAMDFAVVGDGFLLYNLNATDELRRVVHTDFSGRVLNSFLAARGPAAMMRTDRAFAEDGQGNVFYIDAELSEIYQWADNTMALAFTMGYGDKPTGTPDDAGGLAMKFSLVSSKYVVTQFVEDRLVLCNVYDRQAKSSVSGIVATGATFPFEPQLAEGNALYSVTSALDAATMHERPGLYLVRYALK